MTLLPINKIERIAEKRVDVTQIDVYENSISGDAIHGGRITEFSSSGIVDQADTLQLTVKNDVIQIEKDLLVKGTIRVENLQYIEAQVPKLNVTDAVMIDHNEVLWKHALGKSVKTSSLTQLGVLKNLQVEKSLFVADGRVGVNTEAPSAEFSVNVDGYEVITTMLERTAYVGTHSPMSFSIGTDHTAHITCKPNGKIVIGGNESADVSITGKLGIGANNPQESLHVVGNIKFADRIFSSGTESPKNGRWDTGSIVWNDNPQINQSVGWVCIKGGTPGSWRPFGQIN